jgi:hypothetical protein
MISLGDITVPARLHAARVRWMGLVSLLAMPLGWLAVALGEGRSRALLLAGFAVMMLGLAAALAIIPTGVLRIAVGLAEGLDEFQMAARLKAQSSAFRWFSAWVFCMCVGGTVASTFGYKLSTDSTAFSMMFFWVAAWSSVLPAWFLARALPPRLESDGG